MPRNPHPAAILRRATLAVALATTMAFGAVSLTGPAQAAEPALSHRAAGNVVVEWNRTLLTLVQTAGAQPATIQPTRDFAIMSAAVYDAVDAIDPDHPQYLLHLKARRGASQDAAAAQAAHDVLIAMFPTFAGTLDQQLATDLAAIPSNRGPRRRHPGRGPGRVRAAADPGGGRVGRNAADVREHRRRGRLPADPTRFRGAGVHPLGSRDPVRPAPRKPVPAPAARRPEQPGLRRSDQRGQEPGPGHQHQPDRRANHDRQLLVRADPELLECHRRRTSRSPTTMTSTNPRRTFALLDLGLADATIAMYDAKYTYRLWRPITAIRLADTDGNPLTTGDPTWTPLATTPADPSYPGAHSTLSAAAATILTSLYGDDVLVHRQLADPARGHPRLRELPRRRDRSRAEPDLRRRTHPPRPPSRARPRRPGRALRPAQRARP